MCTLCLEVAKEIMDADYFWSNFREIPEEHRHEVLDIVLKTSEAYQTDLANSALRNS